MSKSKKRSPKRKTLKHSFVKQIIDIFAHDPHTSYNYKQLSRALGIGDKASRQLVHDKMLQLEEDGVLIQVHRGKYKLKEEYISDFVKSTEIEGVVDMTMSG